MESKDILIVGGGITGLCIAYFASKANYSVTILEKAQSIGGLLNTFQISNTRIEQFYHHFFSHDAELQWLLHELDIEDKVVYKHTKMGVFINKTVFPFDTPFDLLKFRPLNFFDTFRFAVTSFFLGKIANWRQYENVSAYIWLNRWLGKNGTNNLWFSLLRLKFGPFAKSIPLSWIIGRLRQRMKSRKKGKEQLGYLHGSLQVLLDAIMEKLRENNVCILTEESVDKLLIKNGVVHGVKTHAKEYYAHKTILTIPSPYIAKLLKPFNQEMAKKINQVKYFGVVCVILILKKALSDIYWLNIADEKFAFGGVIEHTNLMNSCHYDGKHIIYLSRYYDHNGQIAHMNDEDIMQSMINQLVMIYPSFGVDMIDNKFVFRSNTAATVCDLNFSQKVLPCRLPIRNLYIANMMHIYPDERSVNNSIRLAAEACKAMSINTNYVPYGSSLSAQINFHS